MHTHSPGGEHEEHTGWAFTTWLDFKWAQSQADVILEALVVIAPQSESQFRSNAEQLKSDLEMLDSLAMKIGRQVDARPLLGSHPVYQYLARRYKLNMQSVHWEPDVDPDRHAWQELEHIRSHHKAAIMLWEDQPTSATAQQLSTRGIESVVFDPCANRPEDADFVSVMRDNLSRLEAVLK
jgi:zinc transport system substrate-binding protein